MKKCSVFLILMLLSIPFHAQETEQELVIDTVGQLPWPASLQARLDTLLAESTLLESSQLGLMVYDLTADSTLYAYNHRQTMRPASTMKVVTAVTALDRLGGDYQMSTSLYYTGQIEEHTLTGSLYCVGGMDPMFDINDMDDFAYRVKQLGVDTLRGSIVTDCSMKDELEWGEGWCWDDDNPKLSPLLVSRKPNFAERLITRMTEAGIVIDSLTLYEDRPPLDAIPLTTCRHSIDQLLLRMMKESDNLYAECLYYQLAASFGHRPTRASHARTLEKQLVNHLGLNSSSYRFADGSGLSLYNYVSPELLTMLLRHAWRTPRIYNHLIASLPIAGVDGTLTKRMQKTEAEGNVRAKTGTLTGIISLAGYLTAANGHELCFAIINQGVLGSREARAFQDRLCVMLCK
jgi:D-alanyl-D-alanine carboxypeptidase/D-alanyl-D-alanine-endopeptidase (penicillin-binding protein 4)